MTKQHQIGLLKFIEQWNTGQDFQTPRHHVWMGLWLEKIYKSPNRQGLLMAFRSAGKSSIVGLFCAWLFYKDPNTRILILAADHALAKKMVRNVKHIIERHPLLEGIVPKKKEQWASDQFTIQRDKELRDPSMIAAGLQGNITGTRADVIICDDVEVPKNSNTKLKREELREKLAELDFIIVPGGLQLYIGTPHTFDTIYEIK